MTSHRTVLRRIFRGMTSTAERRRRPPSCRLRPFAPDPGPHIDVRCDLARLLERVRRRIKSRGLSKRTEETYVRWIERYVRHHGGRHPAALGRADLERYVSHLGEHEGLSVPSRNQAASSIVFLYRELYGQDFGGRHGITRPKPPAVLPRYATPVEVEQVLARLSGAPLVAGMIMYGSGTRVAETMAIRIKDVSLETRELHVRGGKGGKDRTTVIANRAAEAIRDQIRAVEESHARDREEGGGWAPLPGALHRKDPGAGWELGWQYLFPSTKTSTDEKTGRTGRRHLHATTVQVPIKRAGREARLTRPMSCHVLRHCFATEMIRSGCDIRLLQRLMGHRHMRTTARYLHILDRPGLGLVSPLDRLPGLPELEDPDGEKRGGAPEGRHFIG